MDGKVLEALLKSIAHWEANVAAEDPSKASTQGADCALCEMFALGCRHMDICRGCPVAARTGYPHCHATPYGDASDAYEEWYEWEENEERKQEFRSAAQRELDFLRSLLPVSADPNGDV